MFKLGIFVIVYCLLFFIFYIKIHKFCNSCLLNNFMWKMFDNGNNFYLASFFISIFHQLVLLSFLHSFLEKSEIVEWLRVATIYTSLKKLYYLTIHKFLFVLYITCYTVLWRLTFLHSCSDNEYIFSARNRTTLWIINIMR